MTVCRRDRSAVRALRASLTRGRSPAHAPVTSSAVSAGGGPGVDGPQQVLDVLGCALRVVERAVVIGVGGADVGEAARARLWSGGLVGRPGNHEDRPPVTRHGQHGGEVARQPVGRHHHVDALSPDGSTPGWW